MQETESLQGPGSAQAEALTTQGLGHEGGGVQSYCNDHSTKPGPWEATQLLGRATKARPRAALSS